MIARFLIGFSLTSGLLIIVAILTPGWFGLDIRGGENDMTLSGSIFYARVCIRGMYDMNGCTTASVAEAIAQQNVATGVSERWTERTVEAVGCLIGVVIGGIMTIIYAWSVGNRHETVPSNGVGITALILKIIGGICGGILAIEFIVAHVNFDDVIDKVDLPSIKMVKSVPYSLIIMSLGLFLELISIIIYIGMIIKSNRQLPASAMVVLSPTVYGPGTMIMQSTSTTSTTPYARFA